MQNHSCIIHKPKARMVVEGFDSPPGSKGNNAPLILKTLKNDKRNKF